MEQNKGSLLDERKQFEQVAQKIIPGGRLLAAWELRGGLSAQMTALEVETAKGELRRLIVRRPRTRTLLHTPDAARNEYNILKVLHAAGVRVQTPYLLDESGAIFAGPYLVIEYIEGEPVYAPADLQRYGVEVATQLAAVHAVDATRPEFASLPRQSERLTALLQARPAVPDDSMAEGRIRALLEEVWPLPQPARPALLHGDFWPGNLLWQDGKLAAVIDWEDAEVGNPLMDFAITRLDMLWIFGPEAMEAFTRHYQQVMGSTTGLDFGQLPYWDLFAALRPAGRIAEWAAGWPELGRSDITEATMRSWHQVFVNQAFEKLQAYR